MSDEPEIRKLEIGNWKSEIRKLNFMLSVSKQLIEA